MFCSSEAAQVENLRLRSRRRGKSLHCRLCTAL